MLLSEGRNTNHEPFHWLVTSAVAMPGSVLHVWAAHPHSERNRSESYIWPEGRSGCQPESRLSAFAALQTFSQRAQLTALGSKESIAGWSGPRDPAHVATITVAVFPVHGGIQQLSNQPFHPFVSEHEACHDSSSCLTTGWQGLCVRNKPHPNQTKMRWAGKEKCSRKIPLSVTTQNRKPSY